MKINLKDIKKVNEKIEDIDGWQVKSLKSWQTRTGKEMMTVQLVKDSDCGPPLRPDNPGKIPQPSNIQDAAKIAKDNREERVQATVLKKKVKSNTTIVETDDDVTFKIT